MFAILIEKGIVVSQLLLFIVRWQDWRQPFITGIDNLLTSP